MSQPDLDDAGLRWLDVEDVRAGDAAVTGLLHQHRRIVAVNHDLLALQHHPLASVGKQDIAMRSAPGLLALAKAERPRCRGRLRPGVGATGRPVFVFADGHGYPCAGAQRQRFGQLQVGGIEDLRVDDFYDRVSVSAVPTREPIRAVGLRSILTAGLPLLNLQGGLIGVASLAYYEEASGALRPVNPLPDHSRSVLRHFGARLSASGSSVGARDSASDLFLS